MFTFPHEVVDLFAGPGGWSVAAQRLGLREMGIETDKAAHLTRRAAGFHTIRASVTDLGPEHFPRARGLIASPPCQTFSMAGRGAGRKALETVLTAVEGMAHGLRYPLTEWEDPRTGLVLEPLRWVLDAHAMGRLFRWVALEQVPTVLPVWQTFAPILEALGYSVAVGNLQAEQYGVPQTRKRAILIASLDREVALPAPTHSRYHGRAKARLDPGVLPWVSMAQALGWGHTDQPSPTVTGGGAATGGADPYGPRARAEMAELDKRAAVVQFGNQDNSAIRAPDEPAATIRYGARMNALDWVMVNGAMAKSAVRSASEPAPTIRGGHDTANRVWTARGVEGVSDAARVRVTVEEAAALQSFPEGFPWQGVKTKRYQQVGNAIPPLLAEAVLQEVLSNA